MALGESVFESCERAFNRQGAEHVFLPVFSHQPTCDHGLQAEKGEYLLGWLQGHVLFEAIPYSRLPGSRQVSRVSRCKLHGLPLFHPYIPHDIRTTSSGLIEQPWNDQPSHLTVSHVGPFEIPRLRCLPSAEEKVRRAKTETLAYHFAVALSSNDPRLGLGDWLHDIPCRLRSNDILDKAAAAFLRAFENLRCPDAPDTPFLSTYETAAGALKATLQDASCKNRSPHLLAAISMMRTAHTWVSESADGYFDRIRDICQVLNDTVEARWDDSFTRSLRLHLVRSVCIESILDPELQVDSRYLAVLNPHLGPYRALEEEDGQSMESLNLPFLLRLPQLLRAPEHNQEELERHLHRVRTECHFAHNRYKFLSGIRKSNQLKLSDLTSALTQFGGDYAILMGIALVLIACLSSMQPNDAALQRLALETAHEAIDAFRRLLEQLPVGAGFTPVALLASWIATDDPEVICGIFSMVHGWDYYWADPAYMGRAKALKQRLSDIQRSASTRLLADSFCDVDVSLAPDFSMPEWFDADLGGADALGLLSEVDYSSASAADALQAL